MNLLLDLLEGRRQPIQALVESVPSGGAARLDIPLSVSEAVQAQLVGHLGSGHGVGEILLVGEHQQDRVTELVLIEHSVQLITGGVDTISIVRVNDEDKALGVGVVVSPEGADLVLSSDIPHSKANVFIFNSLDVEADGRDGGHHVTELQLVQNGGLWCI